MRRKRWRFRMREKDMQLNVYQKQYEKYIKVRDGAEVFLRPMKHSDEELWLELYNSLSSMSKYYRFFTTRPSPPTPEMIDKYVHIDYVNNFALVALVTEDDRERMVGVARYVLDPPPDSAEIAVTVADDWQLRGLGTKMLMHLLQIMIKRKVKWVHGDIFLENRKMMQLMRESGFKLTKKEDSSGIRHFELQL